MTELDVNALPDDWEALVKLAEFEAIVLLAADCTLTLGLAANAPLGEGQRVRVVVYQAQEGAAS